MGRADHIQLQFCTLIFFYLHNLTTDGAAAEQRKVHDMLPSWTHPSRLPSRVPG